MKSAVLTFVVLVLVGCGSDKGEQVAKEPHHGGRSPVSRNSIPRTTTAIPAPSTPAPVGGGRVLISEGFTKPLLKGELVKEHDGYTFYPQWDSNGKLFYIAMPDALKVKFSASDIGGNRPFALIGVRADVDYTEPLKEAMSRLESETGVPTETMYQHPLKSMFAIVRRKATSAAEVIDSIPKLGEKESLQTSTFNANVIVQLSIKGSGWKGEEGKAKFLENFEISVCALVEGYEPKTAEEIAADKGTYVLTYKPLVQEFCFEAK